MASEATNSPESSAPQPPANEAIPGAYRYPPERPRRRLTRGLSPVKRAQILRYLLLGWRPDNIASECHVAVRTVYNIQNNLMRYGSVCRPHYRQLGRAHKLSDADEEALFQYLLSEGWRSQDELVYWLWHERGVSVSQSTVSRLLKRRNWTRKQLRRISLDRSEALRRAYLDDIRRFAAEDLVFVDESISRENCWGTRYAQCDELGYWTSEDFIEWVKTRLLPAVNQQHRQPMVIVMDNVSIHISEEVTRMIEAEGHLIRFLPPYSPDYNPIELTFSVLKAWMKRHWVFLRQNCDSYGDFLELAIRESRCDRFAREQFHHAAGGVYIEEEELIRFRRFIERYEKDDSITI
ncbi:hypothetical protein T310_3365 [Rasamsonia emersonii CBS 393.64]|uniref:Tc1-like transposase DDE domain-containing protein n=1 Tax=Rasamsonia emersonii (strain ATCC 16479 / CBS 393.64 / IMI 116815) TaxID=1408163 RepID=A0A0F4YWF4_RASE3|nr:hypothetical protein T310_3365 [Rasamsonia emersonii CBS 393.64]KKA22574.1 hypothetical protein T310_3365 [Rasamsonia emersonii CBS 393.64]